MAFKLIEMSDQVCFGWNSVKDGPCWYDVAQQTIETGWSDAADYSIGKSLAKNVNNTYLNICSGIAKDLDDGRVWHLSFINDHGLWCAKIKDNPNTEVLPEDAEQLFESNEIKKFSKRCYDIITRACKCYKQIVEPRLLDGRMGMLDVDTVKLERILNDANTGRFMDNLRDRRYEIQ